MVLDRISWYIWQDSEIVSFYEVERNVILKKKHSTVADGLLSTNKYFSESVSAERQRKVF